MAKSEKSSLPDHSAPSTQRRGRFRGSRRERKKQLRQQRWQRNRLSLVLAALFIGLHFILLGTINHLAENRYPGPDQPYLSSLGIRFLPIDQKGFLFAEFPVQRGDFALYAEETGHIPAANTMIGYRQNQGWTRKTDLSWENPGFPQEEDHPVVGVHLGDAKAFAEWLTQREQAEGRLHATQFYRLPTDREWSLAAGLRESRNAWPEQLAQRLTASFPWGTSWPPPPNVGNLAGQEWAEVGNSQIPLISDYRDDFLFTSPVGSFPPNEFGLYDMTGNVWEWTTSRFSENRPNRAVRGSSYWNGVPELVHPSARHHFHPRRRVDILGFRLVLDISETIE
ncbi:MAG: SUMF1/EgtB/PvdO family nonheme iron enzyme [Opitutales bacterium]|nr:SUMF1/EgtB/PvdO family nonheme iron enzyme [Opitutales bacterium]MCH8540721.1 formylglycine-generating enzyme family protein [Opitutales bacterium]